VMAASMVAVRGRIQREGEEVHLVAHKGTSRVPRHRSNLLKTRRNRAKLTGFSTSRTRDKGHG
jgi:hypothetical protein